MHQVIGLTRGDAVQLWLVDLQVLLCGVRDKLWPKFEILTFFFKAEGSLFQVRSLISNTHDFFAVELSFFATFFPFVVFRLLLW
jgi:hypothetical protein